MTSAARIASWIMLAATLPLFGETQQTDPEEEHERALSEFEAELEAFVELEGSYIVDSVAPLFEGLLPLVETLPAAIADAVNAASIGLRLGRLGIASAKPTVEGIQIYHVHPRSSAAQSGLQPRDTIVSINGATVETILGDPERVQVLVSSVDKGDEPLILVAVRDGEELEIEVENKTLPTSYYFSAEDLPTVTIKSPEQTYSWEVAYPRKDSKAISVLEIEKEIGYYFGVEFGVLVVDTPEAHDQLKPGDIVLKFDDNPIRSYSHLKKYSAEALSSDTVKVRLKRRGRTMNVDFSPKEWFLTPAYEYK